jgi:hypothetical protein
MFPIYIVQRERVREEVDVAIDVFSVDVWLLNGMFVMTGAHDIAA